jgi:thiamine pyrophosphate-dependent acetolactate synthase large subunit-like protein
MKVLEALRALQSLLGDAIVVHANGYIARASFNVEDRPGNFYMIGSMGLASSIALGIAVSRPDKRVVVYDGDGNLLMNLGATAMIAHAGPANLIHVVFDNGVYASTGNQVAVSQSVPLERIAGAAGYRSAVRVRTPEGLASAFRKATETGGPAFILAEIEVESGAPPGARVSHSPEEIRDRVAAAIAA